MNTKIAQLNRNIHALTVEAHPTVPQEAMITHQNALHGEKTASTVTYPITSFKYATKKDKPLTVQMPSLLMCITI